MGTSIKTDCFTPDKFCKEFSTLKENEMEYILFIKINIILQRFQVTSENRR